MMVIKSSSNSNSNSTGSVSSSAYKLGALGTLIRLYRSNRSPAAAPAPPPLVRPVVYPTTSGNNNNNNADFRLATTHTSNGNINELMIGQLISSKLPAASTVNHDHEKLIKEEHVSHDHDHNDDDDDLKDNIININITSQTQPSQPPPAAAAAAAAAFLSWPSFSAAWVKWVMGWIIAVAFPYWKQRWDQLLALEGEAEMVVKDAEKVAEVVEKVALASENMSAQIADQLPQDMTHLKDAAFFIQHISHQTAKDAQSLSTFIHKVDDLKQDLEELETIVIKKKKTS